MLLVLTMAIQHCHQRLQKMLLGQHFQIGFSRLFLFNSLEQNSVVARRSACVRSHCIEDFMHGKWKMNLLLSTITDVKGGLITSLEEEPREGGDLRLVCIANRHLYSDLSWYRLTNQSTTSEGSFSSRRGSQRGAVLSYSAASAEECDCTGFGNIPVFRHTPAYRRTYTPRYSRGGHRCVFNSHCAQHKHTHTHTHARKHARTHTNTQTHSCSL